MGRRAIVTRPAHEASRWVDALTAAGVTAVALPLIVIEALTETSALIAARRQVDKQQALMFVSAAAVSHFVDEGAAAVLASQSAPRCWATGPGTVRALRDAGVSADRIDAPPANASAFDSENLWSVVRSQVGPGTRVLIVRGGDAAGQPNGRDWLAREIEAAGAQADAVASYRRLAPDLDGAARRLAEDAASDGSLWLFTSSEGIANLRQALPAIDWRAAVAIATHARIAEAAQAAGFGPVALSQPSVAAMVASIESFG